MIDVCSAATWMFDLCVKCEAIDQPFRATHTPVLLLWKVISIGCLLSISSQAADM